jgi:hypothetical protein
MDISQESVTEFAVGHGGADVVAKSIIPAGFAGKAYKGIRVRAATANTVIIYVGPQGVSQDTGYPLPAGEEMVVPIDNPSKVYVVAVPAGNSQQVVTLAGAVPGDTFTLTFDGSTTTDIAVDAAAGDVEDAMETLATIGVGNVTITGDAGGPYTIEFTGVLAKRDVLPVIGAITGEGATIAIVKTDASAGSRYSWLVA